MHAGEFHGGLSSLGPPSPDPAQGQSDQALPPFPAGRGLFRLPCRLLSGPAALPERPSRALQQPARRLRHACRAAGAGRGLCQRLQLLHLHPARIHRPGAGEAGAHLLRPGLAAGDGGLGRRPVSEDHGRGQGRAGQPGAGFEIPSLPDGSPGSRGLRGADLGFLRLCESADGIRPGGSASAARPV